MDAIWSFLQDADNRALLGWIGGGIVVVVAGLWAAFTFFTSKKKPLTPTVSANHGSIAAGRDANVGGGSRTKR
jgi:hypothetical protein